MRTDLSLKTQSPRQPEILKLMDEDPFFQTMKDLSNALARRAYELFEGRGRQNGHDLEDWFRAESDLLNFAPVEIDNVEDKLIVRVDVRGFQQRNLEVRVEARRLIITGKRGDIHNLGKRTLYQAKRFDEIVGMFDLPDAIDCDKVTARLQDGTLEIALPKATNGAKVPIALKAA